MWRTILHRRACSRTRRWVRHISCTRFMQKEENLQQAYADLIRYFSYTRDLEHARKLHGKIVDRGFGKDRYLLNLIAEMYGKCRSFEEAKQVFDSLPVKDQMSWSAMITAGSESEMFEEGLEYYRRMLSEGILPDAQVLNTVISCVETVEEASKIREQVTSTGYDADGAITTSLLNMYRRCGRLDLVRSLFESVKYRDVYFWTSMLSALSHSPEYALEAVTIFWRMELEGIRPDRVTFISLIAATSGLACACYAKVVHERVCAHGLQNDVVIASALLHMHGRSGNLDEATKVFSSMTTTNNVTWNSIIAAYSFYGRSKEALHIYRRMDQEGFEVDHVTFASALDACADLTELQTGRVLHDRVVSMGLESDLVIVSALLNMYGKCGKVDEARGIFDGSYKNISCWNSMITAYAQNGHIMQTLELFMDMCHQGWMPDDITFVCLVAACGHAGRTNDGRDIFRLFVDEYGVEASVEHYGCMIDMLGRNGKLQEAEELIENMPYWPDLMAWTAILRACKNSKDQKRGSRLAKLALETYPAKSGPYVLLSQLSTEVENMHEQKDEKSEEEKKTTNFLDLPLIPPCVCVGGR